MGKKRSSAEMLNDKLVLSRLCGIMEDLRLSEPTAQPKKRLKYIIKRTRGKQDFCSNAYHTITLESILHKKLYSVEEIPNRFNVEDSSAPCPHSEFNQLQQLLTPEAVRSQSDNYHLQPIPMEEF